MLLVTKRTEPSHRATLTPPECRLRAALYWEPAVLTGISGSLLAMAQLTTSGEVELGVVSVMNLKTPSSFWMSPRQSLSSGLLAIRYSDIIRVFEAPSAEAIWLNLVTRGVLRLP